MNIQIAKKLDASLSDSHLCRLCGSRVDTTFVDLGMSPLCESFLARDQLDAWSRISRCAHSSAEIASSCSSRSTSRPEHIFNEYAYFSSYSTTWVAHAGAIAR